MPPSVDDPEIKQRKQYVKKTGQSKTAIDMGPSDTIEMESFTPHGEGITVDDELVPFKEPDSPPSVSDVDSAYCTYPVDAHVIIQQPMSNEPTADPKPTAPTKDIPTTTVKTVQPLAAAKPGAQSKRPEREPEKRKFDSVSC